MSWRKPELIRHNVKELTQDLMANAISTPGQCVPDYSTSCGILGYEGWCKQFILCNQFILFAK